MIDVHATVIATGCPTAGTAQRIELTSVTSSEAGNLVSRAAGISGDDIQDIDLGTADFDFKLRAERDGAETARVYSVTYTVVDSNGHRVSVTVHVFVPHEHPLGGSIGAPGFENPSAGPALGTRSLQP